MKRRTGMVLWTIGMMIGISAAACTANAEDGGLAFVKAKNQIVIRENPEVKSRAIAYLDFHDAVWIHESLDDGWCQVVSGEARGYVKKKRLIMGEEAEKLASELGREVAVIYPENLNVREWADQEAEVFAVVHENEEYPIIGYEDEWIVIQLYDGSAGYIHTDYCTVVSVYDVAELAENSVEKKESVEEVNPETESQTYEEPSQGENEYYGASEEYAPADDTAAMTDTYENPENSSADTYSYETDYETSYENSYETTSADQYTYSETVETEYTSYEDSYEESNDYNDYGYDDSQSSIATDTAAAADGSSSAGGSIVDYATQFVGNPYKWGGTSLTDGADCSGFTQSVMANFGIDIPRVAADQETAGNQVDMDNLKEGDLLFYNQEGSGVDHVAIYIGGNQIVHASDENTGIIITDMNYGSTPVSAVSYTD